MGEVQLDSPPLDACPLWQACCPLWQAWSCVLSDDEGVSGEELYAAASRGEGGAEEVTENTRGVLVSDDADALGRGSDGHLEGDGLDDRGGSGAVEHGKGKSI